ncbi:MAG TPA: tetratricopeptide repeat protein [Vicinamibacterales bacterium]|jgi:tetratricopeptide (TPR) repeat protein|nr:tetratricopeptide repeat protein [Vicinamibacterales bacterium]
MTIRFRAASAATLALVCGLSIASAGCGKYSIGTLKAIKAFKDGNLAYAQKDWKKAADHYEAVVVHEDSFDRYPQLATAYFFLGNSYDQLYKPAKQGDPTNDAYIQKAIANYRKAADKNTDKQWKKSALEYLAAAYGSDKLNDPAKAEPIYQEIIALDPNEPQNYLAIAKLYEDAGRYDDAEAQYAKAEAVKPNDTAVLAAKASYYNRQGDFAKTIDALEKAAALEPNNPEGYHRVATFYWEKANKDYRLSPAQKKDYILKGVAMEDKALGLNPDYMEAMTYKNILLRMQANTEKDPQKQKDLLNEADRLRNKVIEAQKRKQTGKG